MGGTTRVEMIGNGYGFVRGYWAGVAAAESKESGGNRVMTELVRTWLIALTAWVGRFCGGVPWVDEAV